MKPVKLAIVGMGMIGRRHLDAIKKSNAAKLIAVVDPDEKVKEIAQRESVKYFSTIDKMLDKIVPEGIIVSTPTELHLIPTILALEAGCHVLVEKPIAATLKDAKEIQEKARVLNRFVLVGHHRRYYEVMQNAKNIISSSVFGKLVGVNGQWTTRKDENYFNPPWRKQTSSGPVLINLIHEIDLLRNVCGEITQVKGFLKCEFRKHAKEDTAAIIMCFDNGALGTFLLSDATISPWNWENATGENQNFPYIGQNPYRFLGAEGCLEFPNLKFWKSNGLPDWKHKLECEDIQQLKEDPYVKQVFHFCRVINELELPMIDASDGLKSLSICLQILSERKKMVNEFSN